MKITPKNVKWMFNTTLLNILAKFSSKEMKDFGEFVKSPFFNKNENVVKLYTYVRKYYPDFKDKKLEKEYVYKKLFSKGKYNDGFMRTTMYNLGKLAEDYLAYINFSKDELNKGINLLTELNERKLEKIFLKYFFEIEEALNEQAYQGDGFFYKKYLMQEQMEEYMDWSKFKNKDFKNFTDKTTTYIDDDLTTFYLIKILNHYRFLLDRMQYNQFKYNHELIDSIVNYLIEKDTHYKNKLKVKLHLYEVLLGKEGKDEYYNILKDILINKKNELSHSDRYSLHNIMQTHCVNKGYRGDIKYASERFELYKICVEQKLYSASEHIYFDDLMFANIALTGIARKEFAWTEDFIEKYKNELSPDNKEVVISYSKARLCFMQGKFEEALIQLNSIKTIKHIQFKMPIRDLTLMIYYELLMYPQAHYQIDSYRHFLANNKASLSDIRFERINNFLKYYTRLVKASEKKSKNEANKIILELEKITNVLEKKWLIEKLELLK